MRAIRLSFLAILAVLLVTVALANRTIVSLNLLPSDLAIFSGVSFRIDLPLFAVVFAGILAGLLVGFVWEWLREGRQRAAAAATRRELARLRAELAHLGGNPGAISDQDEVLALLERAETKTTPRA